MYSETNMQQIQVPNSMHAPHTPEIEKTKGPKGLWPLGAQYLASCSEQLIRELNVNYAEPASSHISLFGSHSFEYYGVMEEHAMK